jgi:hypothetical protein
MEASFTKSGSQYESHPTARAEPPPPTAADATLTLTSVWRSTAPVNLAYRPRRHGARAPPSKPGILSPVKTWAAAIPLAVSAAFAVWGFSSGRNGVGWLWAALTALGLIGIVLVRRADLSNPRLVVLLGTVTLGAALTVLVLLAVTAEGDGWRPYLGLALILSMFFAFLLWTLWSSRAKSSRDTEGSSH